SHTKLLRRHRCEGLRRTLCFAVLRHATAKKRRGEWKGNKNQNTTRRGEGKNDKLIRRKNQEKQNLPTTYKGRQRKKQGQSATFACRGESETPTPTSGPNTVTSAYMKREASERRATGDGRLRGALARTPESLVSSLTACSCWEEEEEEEAENERMETDIHTKA